MGRRISLHIGNNYPGSPYELSGCRNDADDWEALARRNGYTLTRVLFEATAAQILDHIRALVADLRWGDRLLLTYSGHGTSVTDRNGDEADRLDEAIVGADMVLVTDDELDAALSGKPAGAGVLYLPDACFSGTGNRWVSVGQPDGPPAVYRPRRRFIPPTVFSPGLTVMRANILEDARPRYTGPARASLISGASDTEYAWDAFFGDRANGAFTRAAVATWTDGVSLAGWHKRIRSVLPSTNFPQTPQLDAVSLYRRYAPAL